jgi:general secretion pathway protein K
MNTRHCSSASGVALLAVMSAVSVMILVALTFSNSVQLETRTAVYRKEAAQAYAMAVGGVQAALFEMTYPPAPEQRDEPRLWTEGQQFIRVPYAQGAALVQVVNETGKLDLNVAGRRQLARLFRVRGLSGGEAESLAAAIEHWRTPAVGNDVDSEALDDFYRAAGYRAAHNRFASREEALRVRGMTRDIFYGTAVFRPNFGLQDEYGVGQDLTIYSHSTQVNVNYASETVLLSVPGVEEDLAEPIVRERAAKPFKSMNEMEQRLGLSVPNAALPFLATESCQFYSITSVGAVAGSRLRRTVKAVVRVTPEGEERHRILAWYDVAD